jgi:hypothetical protein
MNEQDSFDTSKSMKDTTKTIPDSISQAYVREKLAGTLPMGIYRQVETAGFGSPCELVWFETNLPSEHLLVPIPYKEYAARVKDGE